MNGEEKFPELYFREWPIETASIEEPVEVWADRVTAHQQITNILEYLNSVDRTTLHLMWADLGCGKTHTMGYIKYLCMTKYKNIYPLYTLVPNRVASFLDQYKHIISAFNFDHIAEMVRAIIAEHGENYLVSRILGGRDEFYQIIRSISFGSTDIKSIAKRWLNGMTNISRQELRLIGATRTIKNSDDALAVLQGLSRIVIDSFPGRRLLIMIDEFQRLHESSDRISRNIGIGLHTFYNAVPRRLSILLSFAFRTKANVDVILSPELRSRVDTRSVQLPEMSAEDVALFVKELFNAYRTNKKPPSVLFPLHPDCLTVVINDILTQEELVCPRGITNRIDRLLALSLSKIRNGDDPFISANEAKEILASVNIYT